jgi:ribosomal protein L22
MSPERPSDPPEGTPAEQAPTGADASEAAQDDAVTATGDAAASEPEAAPKRRRGRLARKGEQARQPAEEQAARAPGDAPAEPAAAQPSAGKPPAPEPPAAELPAAETAAAPAAAPSRARKAPAARPRRRVVRASARYVRTPARKARMVCVHLPGKSVAQARAILAFTPREVARDWSKLLESAVANAENNHELLEDDLIIREAYADEGPTIKRFRPRAMGRATPIRKRTSHLTITLTPRRDPTKRAS